MIADIIFGIFLVLICIAVGGCTYASFRKPKPKPEMDMDEIRAWNELNEEFPDPIDLLTNITHGEYLKLLEDMRKRRS